MDNFDGEAAMGGSVDRKHIQRGDLSSPQYLLGPAVSDVGIATSATTAVSGNETRR